ncbi:MAG: hypothetical protein OHK0039_46780 [Bacteroidia bacterium]
MRLRISSIDPKLTRNALQDFIEEIAEIQSFKSFRHTDNSGALALVLVEMKREKDALDVIKELNGKKFGSTPLKVELSHDTIKSTTRKPPVASETEEEEEESSSETEDEEDVEKEDYREVPLDEVGEDY